MAYIEMDFASGGSTKNIVDLGIGTHIGNDTSTLKISSPIKTHLTGVGVTGLGWTTATSGTSTLTFSSDKTSFDEIYFFVTMQTNDSTTCTLTSTNSTLEVLEQSKVVGASGTVFGGTWLKCKLTDISGNVQITFKASGNCFTSVGYLLME